MNKKLSRRSFLTVFAGGVAVSALSGCVPTDYDSRPVVILPPMPGQPVYQPEQPNNGKRPIFATQPARPTRPRQNVQPRPKVQQKQKTSQKKAQAATTRAPDPYYAALYSAVKDANYQLPAIPYQRIDPQFLRQVVDDPTGEKPGTIVVDTRRRYLYLVQENRKAIRYGVGIGREGFAWSGRAIIQYKKSWPRWYPPSEMIARQPKLKAYSAANGGMAPGLNNPLGARALYIFKDGKDTLYRLHGNPEWWSIGKAVSSGCVRLINQDIIDLFNRVPDKTPILVI